MKKFHEWLRLNEAINAHSTHIEDLIFSQKAAGVKIVLDALKDIGESIGTEKGAGKVTTKIDGCLHPDTLIKTTEGDVPFHRIIADFPEKTYVCEGKTENDEIVRQDIELPRITDSKKKWVLIETDEGNIIATEDHLFKTKNGWKEAKDLQDEELEEQTENGIKVINILYYLTETFPQCDMTTKTENFYIKIGEKYILTHNSPAIIYGWLGKKFMVGTKSVFNVKTPKLNFTNQDIEKNHPGALADVLKIALECLKKITPQGRIFQGDFLFSKSTLKSMKVDGEDSWAWHPNTIVYSTPKNSPLGKKIGSAKMGIAVHTEYVHDGAKFSVKGFGVPESAFKKSSEVFLMDANHKTITNTKFTPVEAAIYWDKWKGIQAAAKGIKWSVIQDNIIIDLLASVNLYIRNAQPYPPSKIMVQDFLNYVKKKHVDSMKTEAKRLNGLELLNSLGKFTADFEKIFNLFKLISDIKLILVNKLNSVKQIGTLVMKSDGSLEVTGDEGFVIASGGASGVKIVDRFTFSKYNVSKDIIKGFER
jgi:hypothetical protein